MVYVCWLGSFLPFQFSIEWKLHKDLHMVSGYFTAIPPLDARVVIASFLMDNHKMNKCPKKHFNDTKTHPLILIFNPFIPHFLDRRLNFGLRFEVV